MKLLLIISFFLLAMQICPAQSPYTGGIGSGAAKFSAPNSALSLIDSLYNGNTGSGLTKFFATGIALSEMDSFYNGDTGSGFNTNVSGNRVLSLSDSLYNGNPGDGYARVTMFSASMGITDSLYTGNTGRGDIQSRPVNLNLSFCISDTIVWNGNYSVSWNNAANWDCGIIPGINSIVIIPTGASRYPVIPADVEIKTLFVRPGATILLVTGKVLIINGH